MKNSRSLFLLITLLTVPAVGSFAASGPSARAGKLNGASSLASASCAAAWNAQQVYTGGQVASVGTLNYTAAYWTEGQNPTTNNGPQGSGDPWQVGTPCGTGTPTPTPTPNPPPTPTPTPNPPPPPPPGGGSTVFAAYKDVTVSANFNTGLQQSAVLGTPQPVTSVMPNETLIWSFATGTCDNENWAGITPAQEATNVQAFVSAGKKYILSTGGAAGSFDCSSGAGLIAFINRYNSANLVGVDFDIETGQSQQTVDNLITATMQAEQQFPNLVFSFTIATLGGTSNPITVAGETGTTVVNEIKRLGLGGKYVINLMAMDYGSANASNCVVVNGVCDMGASAIDAAQALHTQSGIPFANIGLTLDLGQNDTQSEVSSLADVDKMNAFVLANGLGASRFWAFDRDTPNGTGGADTNNGNGDPALAYTKEYMKSLGAQ